MNIFFLDKNPILAARSLCDKHVIKMTLETAQILCTVSWRYNVSAPYRQTHKNHPAVLWAGNTLGNWQWTVWHGMELCREYTRRYNKIHKSGTVIKWCQNHGGRPAGGSFDTPELCMPDEYKTSNYVESYRNYYLGDKSRFAKWKNSSVPAWYLAGKTASG